MTIPITAHFINADTKQAVSLTFDVTAGIDLRDAAWAELVNEGLNRYDYSLDYIYVSDSIHDR